MNWPWVQQLLDAVAGAACYFYIIGVCVARGGKIEILESKLRAKDREIEILGKWLESTPDKEDQTTRAKEP